MRKFQILEKNAPNRDKKSMAIHTGSSSITHGCLESLPPLLTTEKGDSPLLPKMKNRFTPNTTQLHRELSTLLSIPKGTHLCLSKPMPSEDRGVKNPHCLAPYSSHTYMPTHHLSNHFPGFFQDLSISSHLFLLSWLSRSLWAQS